MNFDQRSMHLNTEIGLIIDSPELAQQTAARFESMVSPPNSYELTLLPPDAGSSPRLVWRTEEDGKAVEYDSETARSNGQRLGVELLSLLALGLGLVIAPVARAEPPAIVQQEINYLIRYIGDSGCEFKRNGTWNNAK